MHVVAAVILLGLLLAGGLYYRSRQNVQLSEKDTILLTDFINLTGDSVFDGTLKQALATQLEQSPYLNILPESRIHQALRFMGRPEDQRITSEVAREICLRENVKAMLTSSIAPLGSHYVISLNAVNAQTRDSLATEQAESESKEQVLKALDKAASGLRSKLGESLPSVQKYATPLEQASTSSLEALQAYSLGHAAHQREQDEEAVVHLQRAVELDPNFAMAWAELGVCYGNTGRNRQQQEDLRAREVLYFGALLRRRNWRSRQGSRDLRAVEADLSARDSSLGQPRPPLHGVGPARKIPGEREPGDAPRSEGHFRLPECQRRLPDAGPPGRSASGD
jgi:tetratricopeptide (TPR) repeat protein